MPFALILVPLLAQLGPSVGAGAAPPLRQPDLPIPRRHTIVVPEPAQAQLESCLSLADSDPAAAQASAEGWLHSARGSARAEAGWCLGVARARGGDWDAALASFTAALGDVPAAERKTRARLGALAGNAALATGDPAQALALLDRAHGEAMTAGDAALAGNIAIDRARALVPLHREGEAAAALAEARRAVPGEPQAWLLSATLDRRQGHLDAAQGEIERAAALLPADPEVGLEAGAIAVLSGHEEAARKSWQSVVTSAPGSPEAKAAQADLDQLGPPAASSPR